MLAKRIIPCMDVKDGRIVKGIQFKELRDAGDPVEAAETYSLAGADELVFLDITASSDKRKTVVDLVSRVAKNVFIPFTVGGGVESLEDISRILKAGADKISINTQAVNNPSLIKDAAEVFGSQCIVAAIDARYDSNKKIWNVYTHGGRIRTDVDAVEWAIELENLGAGEILLTSMDADGKQAGYDIDLTRRVADSINIPLIASGGAGSLSDLASVLKAGGASAILAASIFHYQKYSIFEVKEYLVSKNIPVRH